MAKIRATVRKNVVNSEGLTTVQIAVSHQQQTAYIATDIKVKPENFCNGRVVRGPGMNRSNAVISQLLYDYNIKLEKIENVPAKTIQQIKDALCEKSLTRFHSISDCFEAYMDGMQPSTKDVYKRSLKVLLRLGGNANLEGIDFAYVKRYHDKLREEKVYSTTASSKVYPGIKTKIQKQMPKRDKYSPTTVRNHLSHLKAVINWCIKEGWVKYDIHPFSKIKMPSVGVRDNFLSPEDFKKIKDIEPKTKCEQESKDLFLLSFYLGGMNMADLLRLDFRGDEVSYIRKKMLSRSENAPNFVLPIIPEARAIIDKYILPNGRLNIKEKKSATAVADTHIKAFALRLGIPVTISFYSARKAFAQIATNLGINDNYINYILGHSQRASRGMLSPYSSMDKRMCGEILKLVVKMSDHPDKIEEIFQERINGLMSKI